MLIITELTEEGLINTCQTELRKKADEFMLKKAVEYCLEEFDIEDFCENYAQEIFDKTEHEEGEYLDIDDIEYFNTYDELRDAGLLNDYCEYMTEQWDCEFEDDFCFIPLGDGCFYKIIIMNTDEVPNI